MSSVEFRAVGKLYGQTRILRDINLHLKDGEFLALLGPSGSGKTTCLRLLAGLEQLSEGALLIDDAIVDDATPKGLVPAHRRRLGMVFQSYAVWPHMNVFENVAYPLRIQGLPAAAIDQQVAEALDLVELTGFEGRRPEALSGGQQQRVALARGLVARPKVLLMDEPLSNLDAKLREKMRRDIRALQQKLRMSCVYVTHDQSEAFEMADKIALLDRGQLVASGTPSELRASEHPFVREFLS